MKSCWSKTSSPSNVVATSTAFFTPEVCKDPPWQFWRVPGVKPDKLSAWNLAGNKLTSDPLSRITHSPSSSPEDMCIQPSSTSCTKTMRTYEVGGEVADEGLEGAFPNWKIFLTTGVLAALAVGWVGEEIMFGATGSCLPVTWLTMCGQSLAQWPYSRQFEHWPYATFPLPAFFPLVPPFE